MTDLFLLCYYHMIVRVLLIYGSDFNVCTDKAKIFQVKEDEKKM